MSRESRQRRHARHNRMMQRRADAQKRLDGASKATTQVAVAGVLIAFAVTIVAVLEGPSGFAPLAPLTRPLIGPVTGLEIIGVAIVALMGLGIWRRLKK